MSQATSAVQSHISQRVDAVRTALKGHVDATVDAVQTLLSGKGVNDLLAVKPVQAGAAVVKDASDSVFDKLIGGNIDVTLNHIKRQAEITRQGRVPG